MKIIEGDLIVRVRMDGIPLHDRLLKLANEGLSSAGDLAGMKRAIAAALAGDGEPSFEEPVLGITNLRIEVEAKPKEVEANA